jgi:hypothetical protein
VLEALKDPREALRRAAQGGELARHLLDVEKTAREIAAIYHKLLGSSDRTLEVRREKAGPIESASEIAV